MIGFPSETDLEMEETVNIGRKVGADSIGIHQTIPFPGTKIYDQAIEEGLIDSDSFDKFSRGEDWGEKDSFFDKWPKYIPEGLSQNYLISAKKRAYFKHYLRPSWAFGRIRHWIRASHWFKHDINLLKLAPHTFLNGKTKTSQS